jgi:UDP-glucose 4-epimerase
MEALVTGVAGFIGSHLAERLIGDGWRVKGIDCFSDYYDRARKEMNLDAMRSDPAFTLIEEEIGRTDLDAALAGADYVFHLAAQPGVRNSWGDNFSIYVDNNIMETQKLLEAAVRCGGLKKFVFASSSSVYGEAELPMSEKAMLQPVSPYGVSKLAAECLCRLYAQNMGLPTVSLRYFTVYGPRQRPDMAFYRFLQSAHEDKEVSLFGDGSQTRDFTFISDIIDGTVSAALKGRNGAVYNLGGGRRISLIDVIAIIERIVSHPIKINHVGVQAGDVRDTYADTGAARKELDYRPVFSLEQGLEIEYDWFNKITKK